jgi:hypothetical protein
MAVAAVDAEFTCVMPVTERNRLRGPDIRRGDVSRARKPNDPDCAACHDGKAPRQEQSHPCIGGWREYLGHSRPTRHQQFAANNPCGSKSFLFWNRCRRAELIACTLEGRNMGDDAGFDYERTDIETGGIAWIAAGLALFVVATPLLMPLVFPQAMQHRTPSAPPALAANAPRLEITPRDDLDRLQHSQDQFENSYGWTDRSQGIVRIPITRAMALLAQRGLEGWPRP